MRPLVSTLANPAARGIGGVGPGTIYEFATIAAAEASGETWEDGDTITITGLSDLELLYLSDLDTAGHSGLIHKDPFNAAGTLSAVALHGSEAANVDPGSWTGWTDASTGVDDTDYAVDTNGGLARFRNLTTSGRFDYQFGTLVSGDTSRFLIIDSLSASSDEAVTSAVEFRFQSYDDGTNEWRLNLKIEKDESATNWVISSQAGPAQDTGIAFATANRLWVYIRSSDGTAAVWADTSATPSLKFSDMVNADVNTSRVQIRAGTLGDSTTLSLGYHLSGNMTIS